MDVSCCNTYQKLLMKERNVLCCRVNLFTITVDDSSDSDSVMAPSDVSRFIEICFYAIVLPNNSIPAFIDFFLSVFMKIDKKLQFICIDWKWAVP